VSTVFASLTSTLAPLLVLACPVGMGVMMWFMARAAKRGDRKATGPASPPSLEQLREEQQRLNAQVERLEQERADGSHATRSET
jgi:hypothetical protein